MRSFFALILSVLTSVSAHAAIIQIDYTGTFSGTRTTGNPAISQFTTVAVGPTPFSLTIMFNTLTPFAFYSDTESNSRLASGVGSSAGHVSGSFFVLGSIHADDTAATGSTSQTFQDQSVSKVISNSPFLSISANHPDIPGSITMPFSISNGLTGSGAYFFSSVGNFSSISESYTLTPETIRVTVDGIAAAVPEPSTWAMLLIGFAGIGCMAYRKHTAYAVGNRVL